MNSRNFNYQQMLQTVPNFDKYTQQILENSKPTAAIAAATTTTATTTVVQSDFFQGIGAYIIKSIQFNSNHDVSTSTGASAVAGASFASSEPNFLTNSSTRDFIPLNYTRQMDMEFVPNQIIIDSSSFNDIDGLQKQMEYDKFMNEIWIGIVLTLILISLIFCICSCCLYHQFRAWKKTYRRTVVQSNANDIESLKTEIDYEDPVPAYSLVSGLPSYKAACELLQKTPKNCSIVYPSVFSVFNKNEKTTTTGTTGTTMIMPSSATSISTSASIGMRMGLGMEMGTTATIDSIATLQQQQAQHFVDSTTPLLADNQGSTQIATLTTTAVTTTSTTAAKINRKSENLPTYEEIMQTNQINNNNNNDINCAVTTIVPLTPSSTPASVPIPISTITIDLNTNNTKATTVNEKELLEFLNENNSLASSAEKPLEELKIFKKC